MSLSFKFSGIHRLEFGQRGIGNLKIDPEYQMIYLCLSSGFLFVNCLKVDMAESVCLKWVGNKRKFVQFQLIVFC